jgi:thiamine pyrophosphate-dependent acetolactate synthase large subunit-like protein
MSLDLKTKARKGAMEQQMAMAMYDRKIKSPYFDPYEVSAEYLCATDEERRRQLKSREEVARIEQENRALEMRERAAKLASSAGGGAMGVGGPMAVGAGGEPGMQAEAGGMPLGEGETGGVA